MKLQRKILLPSLIAFALLMAILRWFILPTELVQHTEQAMQDQYKRLGVLAPVVAEEMLSADIGRIHEILANEENSHNAWAAIRYIDQDGLMIYPLEEKAPPEGIRYYRIEHPVSWSEEPMGQLILELDTSLIQQQLRDQVYRFETLIVLTVISLSLLAAYWNRKIIVKPVTRLAAAARELQNGNFDAPLPQAGKDELGELSRSFERMRQGLQEAQAASQRDNESLQQAYRAIEQKNRDLEQALQQAESAAKAKSQFLAMMSHEIRTPMNGVLGMADILSKSPLNEQQQHYLDVIRTSGHSLLHILNDILDFSKIEAGQLTLSPTDCNIDRLIEQVCQLFASNARKRGLELIALPTAVLKHHVRVDAGRLEQILSNLVSNAIKFTEQGRVDLRASVREDSPGQCRLLFEVVDTGIGIPEQAQKQLFNSFVQADPSTTRKFGGTGLGLAICKQLVELMGGQISIESQEGIGTKVMFQLTLEKSGPIQAVKKPEAVPAGTRILVVDDVAVNLQLFQAIFADMMLQVDYASSGRDALKLIQNAEPGYDILITDHLMPEMSGPELALEISTLPLNVKPAIILTSSSDKDPQDYARFDALLPKPLCRQQLLDEINRVYRDCRSRSAETTAAHPVAIAHTAPALPALQQVRILLVEDVEVNQMVVNGMLETLGLKADWAQNGAEAVQQVQQDYYDLILMDIQMPVMDGYQASSEIRRFQEQNNLPKTPIIALTAHAMKGDMERCYQAGMNDYLTKPITSSHLQEALERWLVPSNRLLPTESLDTETSDNEDSPRPELLNLRVVERLDRELGGNIAPIYQQFEQSLQDYIRDLEAAVQRSDSEQIEKISHRIKGSSRNLGLDMAGEYAQQMEHCAHSDENICRVQFTELKQVVEQTRQALTNQFEW